MKSLRRIVLLLIVPLAACNDPTSHAPPVAKPVATPVAQTTPTPVTEVIAPKPVEATKPVAVVTPVVEIPKTFDAAMAEGKALAQKGDAATAKLMFVAAAKLSPKQAAPHVELARLAIAAKDKAVAVNEAQKAVNRAPESSQAFNTLGRAELLRFAYDKAEVAFRQAAELDATNGWAWNNLGLVMLDQKRYQEAADAFASATALPTAEGYMFNNLGTALEQLDQLDDARVAFEAGGKLGSKEAVASRKRLEGVKTIAIVTPTKKVVPTEKTYTPTDEGEMPKVEEPKPTSTL
jgi:Flp pilus assembly protein TadD